MKNIYPIKELCDINYKAFFKAYKRYQVYSNFDNMDVLSFIKYANNYNLYADEEGNVYHKI